MKKSAWVLGLVSLAGACWGAPAGPLPGAPPPPPPPPDLAVETPEPAAAAPVAVPAKEAAPAVAAPVAGTPPAPAAVVVPGTPPAAVPGVAPAAMPASVSVAPVATATSPLQRAKELMDAAQAEKDPVKKQALMQEHLKLMRDQADLGRAKDFEAGKPYRELLAKLREEKDLKLREAMVKDNAALIAAQADRLAQGGQAPMNMNKTDERLERIEKALADIAAQLEKLKK